MSAGRHIYSSQGGLSFFRESSILVYANSAGRYARERRRRKEARVIVAVTNQKGGVGKTTTAVNVAAALAFSGCRVLLVDTDSQGHSSKSIVRDMEKLDKSLYDVMMNPGLKLASVTLVTESLFARPLVANSVSSKFVVSPYIFDASFAVMTSGAGVIVSVPVTIFLDG